MKRKGIILTALCMASLIFTGCKGGEKASELTCTVKNLTGVEISEIKAASEADKSKYNDCIEEGIDNGETAEVTFGKYTEEERTEGLSLMVYNGEDGSYGDFSKLMLKTGDTVTFYTDNWGLAVAVNMTDEEVIEQRDNDNLAYEEAESETEETTESET